MVTRYKYFEKFYELQKRKPMLTHRELWEEVEEWVIAQIGKPKYTTFGWFRKEKHIFDNER